MCYSIVFKFALYKCLELQYKLVVKSKTCVTYEHN